MLPPRISTPPPGLSILPSHALGHRTAQARTTMDFGSYSHQAGGNLSFTPHSCSQLSHLLGPLSSQEAEWRRWAIAGPGASGGVREIGARAVYSPLLCM